MTPVVDQSDFERAQLAEAAVATYRPGAQESPTATPKFRQILTELMDAPARLLGGGWAHLMALEILSAGFRSVVVRLVSAQGESIVAKFYRRRDSATNTGGFGFAREVAGLETLGSALPGLTVALLASDARARICLLEDLAPAFPGLPHLPLDLSNAILNPTCRTTALTIYRSVWEKIYAQPGSAAESFCSALAQIDPVATSPGSLTSPQLARKGWARLADAHGLNLDAGQRALDRVLSSQVLLTPGDFGPHNILLVDGAPRLFDAEGTAAHHPLLPIADLLLGFPLAPHHTDFLPLVNTQPWQETAAQLYETARTVTPVSGPGSLTQQDLEDALLYTACTALELWSYTPTTQADQRTEALIHRLLQLTSFFPSPVN